MIVNLNDYGAGTNMRWDTINYATATTSTVICIMAPQNVIEHKAYLLTSDKQQSNELVISHNGNRLEVSMDTLDVFASVVLLLTLRRICRKGMKIRPLL
ncbi:hypothetical protein FSB73_22325 [Arachidicoccus ginsenosidivorans]|uniref:Uncharacterized protein n=1 Tax=Arachidicoccus ginsenosidivorans TaxID=496057 RepID=A0A5B8VTS9_9BACT|nr:hypothetical protein [Arachidicoccus ginsenosidivorans]QEC73995.1 hypothetical protein FSB73_22325 [Arachidicoccus ginsenosidivorans]